jgi:hypothetical protein
MATRRTAPVPQFVTQPVASRLLDFFPTSGFGRHLREHPELFPNGTERLFSVADLNSHPNRKGRPITVAEYLRVDNALADQRAIWRSQNSRRKAGSLVPGRGRWQQVQKKAEAGDA